VAQFSKNQRKAGVLLLVQLGLFCFQAVFSLPRLISLF